MGNRPSRTSRLYTLRRLINRIARSGDEADDAAHDPESDDVAGDEVWVMAYHQVQREDRSQAAEDEADQDGDNDSLDEVETFALRRIAGGVFMGHEAVRHRNLTFSARTISVRVHSVRAGHQLHAIH